MHIMKLASLQPQEVFAHFEAISAYPRGSGDEKAVSDFIAGWARGLGFATVQDELWNLKIFKPGTEGRENEPPVILQAHLDMVNEKNTGTQHDFSKDGLDLYIDGDLVKARGTTLGADCGAGVAIAMALLSHGENHPPLEVVLTTDEEAGMGGALALDVSDLKGKRMVNLDSNDENVFTMGCAAGTTAEMALPVSREKATGTAYTLSVSGLTGGHSGVDIHLGRGNALKILAHALAEIDNTAPLRLVEIGGGMKINAIPREASATFIIEGGDIASIVKRLQVDLAEEFRATEATLALQLKESALPSEAITRCGTRAVLSALLNIPSGPLAMSSELEGLTNMSCNLGVAETTAEHVKIQAMPRGQATFYTRMVENQLSALAGSLGAEVSFMQRSPAWPYNPDSQLLQAAKPLYSPIFGREPIITAVHAGLECGIFSDKIPGLDIIAFAPTAYLYHTPEESLSISSMARCWEFFKQLMAVI
jgi:dipeptidase D